MAGLYIRGFYYDSGDYALNGLYGIAPFYTTGANYLERVEVLKGPSALLSGMPPAGAIGGSVNLVTKSAPDFDITQLTATYASKSQFGALVDVARRYGDKKEFGIRFNGGYETAPPHTTGRPTSSATRCSTSTIAARMCAGPLISAIRRRIFRRRCDS